VAVHNAVFALIFIGEAAHIKGNRHSLRIQNLIEREVAVDTRNIHGAMVEGEIQQEL
jgi:hypothetical protein